MSKAEDVLVAVLEFYEKERAHAVESKKIWPRSSATPIPGAGLAPATYDATPTLLKAAPSSHIDLRDILDFCAHLMFKDYYCASPRMGAGAGKYPEIYGILRKVVGLPVFVPLFGKRMEKLRKRVVAETARAPANSVAYDFYQAFLLGVSGWTVGIASTPAAWVAKVEEVKGRYGMAAAAATSGNDVTAAGPLGAAEPIEGSQEVAASEAATAVIDALAAPIAPEAVEAQAAGGVAEVKKAQGSWFLSWFGW
jgi:hypothetical protein